MAVKQNDFEVLVASSPTSLEDWKHAQIAKESELPSLSDAQKSVARKFGVSEEQYRRSFYSLVLGRDRVWERTRRLGEILEELLRGAGRHYKLKSVSARFADEGWLAEISAPHAIISFRVPRALGDDLLDSGDHGYRAILKSLLEDTLSQVKKRGGNRAVA